MSSVVHCVGGRHLVENAGSGHFPFVEKGEVHYVFVVAPSFPRAGSIVSEFVALGARPAPRGMGSVTGDYRDTGESLIVQ